MGRSLTRRYGTRLLAIAMLAIVSGCSEEAPPAAGPATEPPTAAAPPSHGPGRPVDDRCTKWKPLALDGLHDPRAPGLRYLQQPCEALSRLPPNGGGNHVDWVAAIEHGVIEPRTRLDPATEVHTRTTVVYLDLGGRAAIVRFPHRSHTLWLACRNCHGELFRPAPGATPVSMLGILNGEFCGRCHGAVAFPLTECRRCHSLSQTRLAELLARPECRRRERLNAVVVCDE